MNFRYENRSDGLTLIVYCPFWMLNKTGLMLSYRVRLDQQISSPFIKSLIVRFYNFYAPKQLSSSVLYLLGYVVVTSF